MRKDSPVLMITVIAVASCGGCADECPPVRCETTPPILLTVVDGVSGELLDTADVMVDGTPDDWIREGCDTAGVEFDCTHEVLSVGGHDELLRPSSEEMPGYGPWQAEATVPVDVTVTASGFTAVELQVELHADPCGTLEPKHKRVTLMPVEQDVAGSVSDAEAPPTCRERR